MNVYVLYHDNCPDGFAAATVVWLTFGQILKEKLKFIPVSYQQDLPDTPQASQIYVVDFSYKRGPMLELASRVKPGEIVVLDHHETAEAELKGLDFARFDMSKSGAVMTWEYLYPASSPVPKLLEYVQDRDLWTWNLPNSRQVSAYLSLIPRDFATWAAMIGQPESWDNEHCIAIGRALLDIEERQIESIVKHAKMLRMNGFLVPYVNCPGFLASVVGERLCRDYPDSPFSATLLVVGLGLDKWSLRSRSSGFHCGKLAEFFGGGGHAGAAGFVTRRGNSQIIEVG